MMRQISTAQDNWSLLGPAEVDQFTKLGYLILPAIVDDDLVCKLRPEVDHWVDDGLRAASIAHCLDPDSDRTDPVLELELPAHGEIIAYPPLMAVVAQLLGRKFAFHHLHSDRQAPDRPGKPWHHDYEQRPQTNRDHVMVHTLHYLDGLDEQTAALTILPGSHREVAEKSARAHLGTDRIADEVVISQLPVGSTVVLHSALFHARRPGPVSQGRPRYLIDSSYCQAGVQWPPVKPYWRYLLSRGRDLGLDRGCWPDLFAEHHFAEYVRAS